MPPPPRYPPNRAYPTRHEGPRPQSGQTRDVLGDHVLREGHPPPPWMIPLTRAFARRFAPGVRPPRIVVTPAPGRDHFCGRHFPGRETLAICLSTDPALTRAVLVHELSHWARLHQGAPEGHHDAAFFALVARAYSFFQVDRRLVLAIDPELAGHR